MSNESKAGTGTGESGAKLFYESYWSAEGYRPRGAVSRVIAPLLKAAIAPGARCLDVGCGDGTSAGAWICETGAEYLGVDISAGAVGRAQENGYEAQVIEDATTLPFPDRTFDVVVLSEVLEHLFEPQAALLECLRVLRDGGSLLVTVPNIVYWRRRIDSLVGRWHPGGDDLAVQQPWRDPHIRFFTIPTMQRLLTSCGFAVIEAGARSDVSFLREIPGVRTLVRAREPGRVYARLERLAPGLMGGRVYARAERTLG